VWDVKLLLTSAGVTNRSIEEELRRLTGQPAGHDAVAVMLRVNDHRLVLVDISDLRDLHGSGWQQWACAQTGPSSQRLRQAQVVYLVADSADDLARHLNATGLTHQLRQLAESAVVVAAGAACALFRKQLNLLPWSILTQVDFDDWDAKAAERAGFPLFAIDDQTAVSVTDGAVAVVGQGRWRFIPAAHPPTLPG
jgi:dipeptidase E